jgi:hypothetical protein
MLSIDKVRVMRILEKNRQPIIRHGIRFMTGGRIISRWTGLTFVFILLAAVSANAQTEPEPDTSAQNRLKQLQQEYYTREADTLKQKCLCWLPGRLQYCKFFLLTETGLFWRFSGDPDFYEPWRSDKESGAYVTGDLGLMANLDNRNSLGGSVQFGLSSNLWRFSFKPRYRRWLTERFYLDAAAGLILVGESSNNEIELPGFSAHLAAGVHRAFDLRLALEVIDRYEVSALDGERTEEWTDASCYVGGAFGGSAGVIFAVLLSLSAALAAASFSL